MQHILASLVLGLVSAPVFAAPVVLINCASGQYRGILDTILPQSEAAGVIMTDAAEAHLRAEAVVRDSVAGMIKSEDVTGVVRVTKRLEEISNLDTTCLVFAGFDTRAVPIGPAGSPAPPTTWSSRTKNAKAR